MKILVLQENSAMKYWFLFYLTTHLLSGSECLRIYLATYPRSGNTWTRLLIEDATGIATYSAYDDRDFNSSLLPPSTANIFYPNGGFAQIHGLDNRCRLSTVNEMIVVKTHFPYIHSLDDNQARLKVIRIVRNPVDSIYSYYVFSEKPYGSSIDRNALNDYINSWKNFQNYWNNQSDVITFRYEDLLNNCEETFTSLIEELGFFCSQEDIKRAISHYPPQGKELKSRSFFSESDIKLIEKELKDLLIQFNYTLGLDDENSIGT